MKPSASDPELKRTAPIDPLLAVFEFAVQELSVEMRTDACAIGELRLANLSVEYNQYSRRFYKNKLKFYV